MRTWRAGGRAHARRSAGTRGGPGPSVSSPPPTPYTKHGATAHPTTTTPPPPGGVRGGSEQPPAPVPPVTYLRERPLLRRFSSSSSSPGDAGATGSPIQRVRPICPRSRRARRQVQAERSGGRARAGAGGEGRRRRGCGYRGGEHRCPAASQPPRAPLMLPSPQCCFIISCPSCDTRRPRSLWKLKGDFHVTTTNAATGPSGTPHGADPGVGEGGARAASPAAALFAPTALSFASQSKLLRLLVLLLLLSIRIGVSVF